MAKTECTSPDRLRQLDGLRGLAACAVGLFFHIRVLYSGQINPLAGIPGISWFQTWGWSMVDLFFVLSGFVFAHRYLKGWSLRSGVTPTTFAIARVARLWPLHLALLFYMAFLLRSDPQTTGENILLSASMLQVFSEHPTNTLNGPAWSLSVEMICYAVFAAAAFAGPRSLKTVAVLAIGWGAFEISGDSGTARFIGRGMAGFFTGVALCNAKPVTDRIPTIALLPIAALPFLIPPAGAHLLGTSLLAWPALILVALRTSALGHDAFVWLGDRSYAIYLCHVPIYTLAGNIAVNAGVASRSGWLLLTAGVWIAVLVMSNILYLRLERPAQKAILNWHRNRTSPDRATIRS